MARKAALVTVLSLVPAEEGRMRVWIGPGVLQLQLAAQLRHLPRERLLVALLDVRTLQQIGRAEAGGADRLLHDLDRFLRSRRSRRRWRRAREDHGGVIAFLAAAQVLGALLFGVRLAWRLHGY